MRWTILCHLMLAAACGEPEAYEPCHFPRGELLEGECAEGLSCISTASHSICLPECETVSDCPIAGTAEIFCDAEGDCVIQCASASDCLDDMICIKGGGELGFCTHERD